MLDETPQTTIKNEVDRYLSENGLLDREVLAETPDQHECAMQAMRMLTAYQTMRDTDDGNVRGQSAHTMLVLFKDMQTRHQAWIVSVNRFLDREHYKGADVQAWASKAWRIFHDWRAMQKAKQEADEKKANEELAKLNRQLRGQQ